MGGAAPHVEQSAVPSQIGGCACGAVGPQWTFHGTARGDVCGSRIFVVFVCPLLCVLSEFFVRWLATSISPSPARTRA